MVTIKKAPSAPDGTTAAYLFYGYVPVIYTSVKQKFAYQETD